MRSCIATKLNEYSVTPTFFVLPCAAACNVRDVAVMALPIGAVRLRVFQPCRLTSRQPRVRGRFAAVRHDELLIQQNGDLPLLDPLDN